MNYICIKEIWYFEVEKFLSDWEVPRKHFLSMSITTKPRDVFKKKGKFSRSTKWNKKNPPVLLVLKMHTIFHDKYVKLYLLKKIDRSLIWVLKIISFTYYNIVTECS